ncbi:Tim44 domain-containing protein [Azohydromonas lata]|uniref:Tim44-like domain-containing protein n=1 Tax=Azohydromonas lata TaxID=45677 RepID=A0ABU5IFV6_9BURK|nr:Tim44-like domain-containing protein [Azohydromonas lata]MDZ5457719.1 Tim44-like domain-containing protein [Azohydromonas lata]
MSKTRTGLLGALMLAVAAASFTPVMAEAKRLGGGSSSGLQRSLPARSTPQTPPPQQAPNQAAPTSPAAPAQQAQPGRQATAPAAGAAAAAAAAPKRNWLGPIAGLAAGLGIAALLSHFGMGEAVANFVMMALLAVAAIFLIRFLVSRFAGKKNQPAYAGAGAGAGLGGTAASTPWNQQPGYGTNLNRQADSFGSTAQPGSAYTPAAAADGALVTNAAPQLPADFDAAAFERVAKTIFIRMQAANDTGDLNDLRSFTTPEMFASAKLDLQDRAGKQQTTDVVRVDAQVVDWAQEADRQVVSVRYSGLIREDRDAPATDFDEVWHLVRPADGSRNWAIAGIQQYSH